MPELPSTIISNRDSFIAFFFFFLSLFVNVKEMTGKKKKKKVAFFSEKLRYGNFGRM